MRKKINKYNLFLILGKGGNMSQYSIDDEVTQKLLELTKNNKNAKDFSEVLKNVQNFQKRFSISTNSEDINASLNLKKLADIEINDEKIKEQATNELSDFKNSTIKNIETESENKKNELNQNKNDLKNTLDESVSNLNSYYDNVKQQTSDDALKRGLSRSSIVVNKLDAFNKEQLDNFNKLNEEYSSSINSINFELQSLEGQKKKALNEFDIEYAYKLSEKISDLTDDLNKKQAEITKYNNDIAKIEADYEIKYAELKKQLEKANKENDYDLLELITKYGENTVNNFKQSKSVEMIGDYLKMLEKADAKNVLVENEMSIISMIGENAYSKLLSEYN